MHKTTKFSKVEGTGVLNLSNCLVPKNLEIYLWEG